MSTQAVHFLKITGRLAREFESACESVRRRRKSRDDGRRGGDDWSARDRERIDHLGLAILSTARSLPVVWSSAYIDGYSWPRAAEPQVGWTDGVSRGISSLNTNIAYFPATILPAVLLGLKRKRRPNVYDLHLRMAIEAMVWATGDPLVVVISTCLGGSWEDTEVHSAANASLRPLLSLTRGQLGPRVDGRKMAGLSRRLHNLARKLSEA